MTWFRGDPGIQLLLGFGSDPAIQEEALALARHHANPKRLIAP
jgi:hypothetical protein